MIAAGLAATPRGRRHDDEECFENLLQVWTHYGRPPTRREMYKAPSVVGPLTYARLFGSWTKAMEAFIDRVNSDSPATQASKDDATQMPVAINDTPVPERQERRTKKARMPESDKHGIRLGLRYAVLKRDRFRCVICGRSPATRLGVNLHVDHIVAWANGGKTVIENLRSTCEDCNRGKGSKREEGEPGARIATGTQLFSSFLEVFSPQTAAHRP